MTKLTFDVDFNKDPEDILREIQERAKAEVAKRESKIRSAAYLSKLHEKVNDEIGTEYKSVGDLIRALTQFANPKLKEKISSSSPSGRRVTITMTRDIFEEIKSKLAQPNPNKAAIARETGVSVVQVRKVAIGGYDAKFSSRPDLKQDVLSTKTSEPESKVNETPSLSAPALDIPSSSPAPEPVVAPIPVQDEPVEDDDSSPVLPPITPPSSHEDKVEEAITPPAAPSLDLPPVPAAPEPLAPPSPTEEETSQEESAPELPPITPPSSDEDKVEEAITPPAAPSLDLPPVPAAPEPLAPPSPTEEETSQEESAPELPPIAPPSLGEEIAEEPAPLAPPPAPSLDLPPVPSAPEPLAPPSPAEEETPPTPAQPASGAPKKPSLSIKSKGTKPGLGGKPGKPTLSLKSGKKKTSGLKITRPPMKPPSA